MTDQLSDQIIVGPLSLRHPGPRKRISPKQKILIHEYLEEKYGHKCAYCDTTTDLTIHHKDGNRNNTILKNLAWACKECQTKLWQRVVMKAISLSANTNLLLTPLDKNQLCEPAWVTFTRDWTKKVGPIPIKVFIRESAFESKCHPKTAEGYLFKYTAQRGHLRVTQNAKGERFVEPNSGSD